MGNSTNLREKSGSRQEHVSFTDRFEVFTAWATLSLVPIVGLFWVYVLIEMGQVPDQGIWFVLLMGIVVLLIAILAIYKALVYTGDIDTYDTESAP